MYAVAGAFVIVLILGIVVQILFLLNLHRTLERVSVANRRMLPGLVWLNIIPIFGYVWFFYTVAKIRDSVRDEYRARGWQDGGDFGYSIGIATAVLEPLAYISTWWAEQAVAMSLVLGLGAMVCLIIYWVKTARLKRRLGPAMPPPYLGYGRPPFGPAQHDQNPWMGDQPGDHDDVGGDEASGEFLLCPVCASPTLPEDRFCHVCGTRLPWDDQ